MNIPFIKYQGTGNDFIIIDDRGAKFPSHDIKLIKKICHRKFGIGADGLILLQTHPKLDFYMKYFNSDGNESSMCGNGGRCIVAFAHKIGVISKTTHFMAIDGAHSAIIHKDEQVMKVELQMKDVQSIEKRDNQIFILNTGSPHFVKLVNENLDQIDIVSEARLIRYGDEFKAEGINVNFVKIDSANNIGIRTYERGVEDETLSCGTGVTAAAICINQFNNREDGFHKVQVMSKGGKLSVSYDFNSTSGHFTNIRLTGPAQLVYEGIVWL